MLIDTAVRIGTEETDAQPNATECPVCFAIVRRARLADHQQAAHAEGGE